MNAVSSWKKQEGALREAAALRPSPDAVLPEYLRALDAVRAETMAAQPDEFLRQQAGVLFEQARQAGLMMKTVSAEMEEARPARQETRILPVVGLSAGFLACAASLLSGEWLAAALALAAALSILLPMLRAQREEQTKAVPRTAVHAERLVNCGEQMMQRIDGYLGDFGALNRQIAGQAGGGADMKALALCQELWENRGEGPDADNIAVDQCIAYLLQLNGCEMQLYDAAHALAFSMLPSRSESRTIRPAIAERETGRVLLRGLAAVREEKA